MRELHARACAHVSGEFDMKIVNWIMDQLNDGLSGDVVDSYFVQTSLVDLHMTDKELCERAEYDDRCSDAVRGRDRRGRVPIGKQVW